MRPSWLKATPLMCTFGLRTLNPSRCRRSHSWGIWVLSRTPHIQPRSRQLANGHQHEPCHYVSTQALGMGSYVQASDHSRLANITGVFLDRKELERGTLDIALVTGISVNCRMNHLRGGMGRGRCASVLLKCMGMYPANQGVLCGLLPCPLDIRLSYSRTAGHHTHGAQSRLITHEPHPRHLTAAACPSAKLHTTYISSV